MQQWSCEAQHFIPLYVSTYLTKSMISVVHKTSMQPSEVLSFMIQMVQNVRKEIKILTSARVHERSHDICFVNEPFFCVRSFDVIQLDKNYYIKSLGF